MSEASLVALVDRLRALPAETEWFEFKANHCPPEVVGEYLSALSNSAALNNQQFGYLIFGVDDASHEVVGTSLDVARAKAAGSQDLILWLLSGLKPNPGVEAHTIGHSSGRVVIFAVGQARDEPVSFHGSAWIRVGPHKTRISNHPERARVLWTRSSDWSAETCPNASMADLDPTAITKAREQFAVKHHGQALEIDSWDVETFLNKARVLRQGRITNAAVVLLGRPEAASLLAPSVAKISWILKDAENREQDYDHIGTPFLLAGDRILLHLRNLTVRTMPSGTLFPQEISQYDTWVIREALHNAIAHQDYRRSSRVAIVEFPDKILIENEGVFLPGSVETVIRQNAPQTQYRNPFLADAMVELNMIDTQGGGIKRMFETQRRRSFPLPDYDLTVPCKVSVTVDGRIVDERYTRLLMEQTDLPLLKVMLLDQLQKGRRIDRAAAKELRTAKLIEGRYPDIIVAGAVAKAAGQAGRHIRQRGFDNRYYLDMLLELVKKHAPVGRPEIDDLLLPKLPERLSAEKKRRKVDNLLQELRRHNRIENRGSRGRSKWVLKA